MSARIVSLCLTLVLVTAWTDDLQAGTFRIASPTGTPSFGQEIYPLAIRSRAELHQVFTDLAQISASLDVHFFGVDLAPHPPESAEQEMQPGERRSCYVLMCLQR